MARGGPSYAAWACESRDLTAVERWVRSRGEARRVRVVDLATWRPRRGHAHVYVVTEGHPALAGEAVQP